MSTADFYLSRAERTLQVPRERLADQGAGQAAAARHGRPEGLAEPRRGQCRFRSTTFTPLATGGAAANPLTSFGYRTIGIIVEMTPRVTYDGDIILDLTLENSARGGDVIIAGQALPAFTLAQGRQPDCACGTASPTSWPDCCARTSASR